MKKMIFTALSALLILGFVNGPVQVGAASKAPEVGVAATVNVKNVTVARNAQNSWELGSTYYYNVAGYTGTLTRNAQPVFNGDRWIATYSGRVTCSVACGATN